MVEGMLYEYPLEDRGIQKYGHAPVELYIFPGEPHVLQKLSHQRRKMFEEQRWFDKYLFSNK